jgi:hypothetical protein
VANTLRASTGMRREGWGNPGNVIASASISPIDKLGDGTVLRLMSRRCGFDAVDDGA